MAEVTKEKLLYSACALLCVGVRQTSIVFGQGKSTEIICLGGRYINMTGHEGMSTVALQICQGIKESTRILSTDKSFVNKNVSKNK